MHSPFGLMQQIVKETGWTWHYILWGTSWANIMLMLADRPGFKKKSEVITKMSGREGARRFKERRRNG